MLSSVLSGVLTVDLLTAAVLSSDNYFWLAIVFFGAAIVLSVLIGLLDIAFVLLVALAVVLFVLGVYSWLSGAIVFVPLALGEAGVVLGS